MLLNVVDTVVTHSERLEVNHFWFTSFKMDCDIVGVILNHIAFIEQQSTLHVRLIILNTNNE